MVEMWWGRSTWRYPEWIRVEPGDGRLYLNPPGETEWDFRGSGGIGSFGFFEETSRFRVLAQYWLDPDRMPETGQVFDSLPRAEIAGVLVGESGPWALLDVPSVRCTLTMKQRVFSGDELVTSSRRSERLINIEDHSGQRRERRFENPERISFGGLSFVLDRSRPLTIDLELELEFVSDRETWSGFRFLPVGDHHAFWIRLPQWNLVDTAFTLI